MVKQPTSETETSSKITSNSSFTPYFDHIVGAIDGTHIDLRVPSAIRGRYYGRKNKTTINVMAACDFSYRFLYVLAGFEGTAHDSRVLNEAINKYGFRIPTGKGYLADAEYAQTHQVFTPYRGVRYHLNEWGDEEERLKNKEELYNKRHSQLRISIEKIFGALQKKFPIMKENLEYSLLDVNLIVYSCAGTFVHLFMFSFL
jgi:hypothetical protein